MFVDAAVFMYLAGRDHPLKAACDGAIRRAIGEGVELVTDAEVLQEILYRYFMLERPQAARAVFAAAARLCHDVLPVRTADVAAALDLLLQLPSLPPRDAIHVAVMRNHDLECILTPDRDFDAVPGIRRVDPADIG